jgi:hypothetical protein
MCCVRGREQGAAGAVGQERTSRAGRWSAAGRCSPRTPSRGVRARQGRERGPTPALPAQLTYIKNGQVQALLGQDCYGWGHETVMMLFDKVHNHKNPAKVINTFNLQVVTKDNVKEYEGIWDKWLGKKK